MRRLLDGLRFVLGDFRRRPEPSIESKRLKVALPVLTQRRRVFFLYGETPNTFLYSACQVAAVCRVAPSRM
jgi:hypothetical protein